MPESDIATNAAEQASAPGEPDVPDAPDVRRPSGEDEPSKEVLFDALRHVIDPELGVNIVDLGLVYGVEQQDAKVHVTYTLTTMGCPIGPLIEQQIQGLLVNVPGVEEVTCEMVLRPAWTPEMMSDEAKAALGFF